MAGGSGASKHQPDGDGGVLGGSWVWIALPIGILVLIAALWFLVIAPAGSPPPRVTATPASSAADWPTVTPMVVTVPTLAPVVENPTPTVPSTLALGARVEVAGTGVAQLRVRQSPGTGSVTLKLVPDGTAFVIVGGPEEAGGVTWWKVDDQAGTVGWAAGQFLKVVP